MKNREKLHYLNTKLNKNTLMETLNIKFTNMNDNYLEATMPVNRIVHQPFGYLHGGASLALAESLGSTLSSLHVDLEVFQCFGLEIAANHIKAIRDGSVVGTAKFIHKGFKTHVIDIELRDNDKNLVCKCKMTNILIEKK